MTSRCGVAAGVADESMVCSDGFTSPTSAGDDEESKGTDMSVRVWWCEIHGVGERMETRQCWRGVIADDLGQPSPCSPIVEMLLTPLPQEESGTCDVTDCNEPVVEVIADVGVLHLCIVHQADDRTVLEYRPTGKQEGR